MRKFFDGETFTAILILLLLLAPIGGWIANIVKLAGMINDPVTGMMILRTFGVVVLPLGAILGFV